MDVAADQAASASQAVSGSNAADFASLIMDNPDGDVFKTELSLKAMLSKQEEIADEIAQKSAMVGDAEPVTHLKKEYHERDKKVPARIDALASTYESMRMIRPDGNAFYRAFAFAYFESLLDDIDELMNAQDIIRRAREDLIALGYPLFSFEIFYDVVYHVLKSLRHGITRDDLLAFFNHPLVHSVVAFLRLVTSAHLKLDSEYYMKFYHWSKKDLEAFCAKEVEPMNIEAEDIQMTALAARFGIATRVEYVEPTEVTERTWGKPITRVRVNKDYLEGWDPRIYMISRPGQFDILYKIGRSPSSRRHGRCKIVLVRFFGTLNGSERKAGHMEYNGSAKRQLDSDETSNDKENAAANFETTPKKSLVTKIADRVNITSDAIFGISSSPPRFVSLEEIIKATKGVENMALAHEIAVDQNFKLEEKANPSSPLEDKVKQMMNKAFFDVLRSKLNESPPDFTMALDLLREIKEDLHACLMPHNTRTKEEIDTKMDSQLLKQQADAGQLEIMPYLQYCVSIMAKICCRVRDDAIMEMTRMTDIPDLFRNVLETLKSMKLDLANFTISAIRPHLQAQSVEYERKKFSEFLKACPSGLENTTNWLKKHCDEMRKSESLPNFADATQRKILIARIITSAYLELLTWTSSDSYPETCSLDFARFISLGEMLQSVSLLGTVMLITMMNAGQIPQGLPGFRETLKKKLKILLEDESAEKTELEEKLRGAGEVIAKDIDEALVAHSPLGVVGDVRLSVEVKASLIDQIASAADPNHNIRKLVEQRIRGFLEIIINSATASPTKFPPGLTSVHEELKELAAMFLQLTVHNRRVFMSYYADIINKEFGIAPFGQE
ncbi:unnamed protein product [Notodromas monacha]|uniref:ubiquitinyl hydrolase 1 n=1 Tax=Notodromas monacha TaxID=399045 RepID=A0A7R9BGE3_9CRUS|nr:unnamed protein product [Notodromas monacha]CAG0913636.1 unnamed protein product [Notodromas monacha]